jgi:hypothetical protein
MWDAEGFGPSSRDGPCGRNAGAAQCCDAAYVIALKCHRAIEKRGSNAFEFVQICTPRI